MGQEMWISKQEFDEAGPGIVHRKCFKALKIGLIATIYIRLLPRPRHVTPSILSFLLVDSIRQSHCLIFLKFFISLPESCLENERFYKSVVLFFFYTLL